mmetsp:Transcript_58005/g.160325  ORF Transcript_58005/g.160325 Transcript_58005/m.160325 type:complete len:400 (-) Transcript_58005:122-1321(-)
MGQVPQGARLPPHASQTGRSGEEQADHRPEAIEEALPFVRANADGAAAQVRGGDEGEDADAARARPDACARGDSGTDGEAAAGGQAATGRRWAGEVEEQEGTRLEAAAGRLGRQPIRGARVRRAAGGSVPAAEDVPRAFEFGGGGGVPSAQADPGHGVRRPNVEALECARLRPDHERRGPPRLDVGRRLPPGGHPPLHFVRRQDGQGLGLCAGLVHPNLRGPHAGGVGRGRAPFGRLRGVVLDGPHHAPLGPQLGPLPPDLPWPRRQRQQRLLAALLQQRVYGLRRQDRVALGRALGPLRADLLRPFECVLEHLHQQQGRHHRLVRCGRRGEAVGCAHGCRDRHHRGVPASCQPGLLRPQRHRADRGIGRRHGALVQHGDQGDRLRAAWARGRRPGRGA